MDRLIFEFLHSAAGFHPLTDQLIIILASPTAIGLAAITGLALIWPEWFNLPGRSLVVAAGLAAGLARFGLKELIVWLESVPRPFEVLTVNQLIDHGAGGSFPSGHMIFFFALGTTLIFGRGRLGGLILAGASLIGLARIMAGLHWPSDILGGAALGILLGWLAGWCWYKYFYQDYLSRYLDKLKQYNYWSWP